MARHFIALYYEGDITKWLRCRFPKVKGFAVAHIENDNYHILVSEADANVIKEYLTKDIVPPFCRRIVHSTKSSHSMLEPGLDFQFDYSHQSNQSLKHTAVAYRSLSRQLSDPHDRTYIHGKLAELDAQVSQRRSSSGER